MVRRYGNFDTSEDAVQEALLAAATQWPAEGMPDNPKGWLITVAARWLTDLLRSEQARRRREDAVAHWELPKEQVDAPGSSADADDTLILLFMCCHPAVSPPSQIALTLRAVGGLTTAEVARAFLVSEATMTRRITRAKAADQGKRDRFSVAGGGRTLRAPSGGAARYLSDLHGGLCRYQRPEPATRRVVIGSHSTGPHRRQLLPEDSEVAGLLALMLLTDARRPARATENGELVPIADQDRNQWDAGRIAEGVALITEALPRGPTGPYQLQAAIAAIHDEAPSAAETDWQQIKALYVRLLQLRQSDCCAESCGGSGHGSRAGSGTQSTGSHRR